MSIKLTSPILYAGAHVPVDGATLSYDADLEADLVNRNMAVYVSNPAQGGLVPVMASKDFTGGVSLLGPNGEDIKSFPKPKHRVVREFVTLRNVTNTSSGTPAVASIDLNSPFGGPAMKLAIPIGCTDHTVTISGFSLPNFTAGRGKLVILAYFSDSRGVRTSWNSIGTTTGFSPTMRCVHDLATDGIHHSHGVQAMTIHSSLSAVNTLATTDTVTALKLVMLRSGTAIANGIHDAPGGVTCDNLAIDVWIKGAYLVDETKPYIVLTMDDGTSSQYDNLQPLLAARGLKATLGIISGLVGSNDALYMTTTELQAMYGYGHDLCPHNVANTTFTIATHDAYVTAFRTCRDYLQNLGRTRRLDYHPYVGGVFNPELSASMKSEGVKWARTVNDRNFERPLWDYGFHGQLPSRSLGNGSSLSTAQAWITGAEAAQQDVIIMGHEFKATAENSTTWATSDMELFLDFCLAEKAAGRIAGIGSLSEYARYLGFES